MRHKTIGPFGVTLWTATSEWGFYRQRYPKKRRVIVELGKVSLYIG